jgi:hypothetical protein
VKLHLHIDRLVVPEGTTVDPARLAAAVQQILADRLHDATPADLLAPDLRSGGTRPSAPPVPAAATLPQSIAGAVLGALKGPR